MNVEIKVYTWKSFILPIYIPYITYPFSCSKLRHLERVQCKLGWHEHSYFFPPTKKQKIYISSWKWKITAIRNVLFNKTYNEIQLLFSEKDSTILSDVKYEIHPQFKLKLMLENNSSWLLDFEIDGLNHRVSI